MAKKAKRRVKRINGVLTVVYVDADTGAVLDSLDGYELYTSDGFSNAETEIAKPAEPEPVAPVNVGDPSRDKSSNADFWTKSDWAKDPSRSKGTGDILGDFRSAAGVLGERIDGVKGTLMNGILTTAGRAIGRNLVADKDNINNAVDGAVDAAGNAVTGAIERATGLADGWLGDTIGGFFGGNEETESPRTLTGAQAAGYTAPGIAWNGKDSNLEPELVAAIDSASTNLTFGLNVVSGYRTREQNEAAGGASQSQHIHGNAIDISIKGMSDAQKSALVTSLAEAGAKRIGIYSGNTGLHVDMAEGYPPPEGFTFYPMFDSSFHKLGNAPAWFVETAKGNPLPEASQYMKTPDNTTVAGPVASRIAPDTQVDPKLLAAVASQKARQGQQVIVDSQPIAPEMITSNFGDEIGMSPIQGGNQMAPQFNAAYDPELGTVRPTEVGEASTPGFGMLVPAQTPLPSPEPFKARRTQPIVEADTALSAANSMGTGLDPVKKAYLDAIHYAEGNPSMNQAFGVNQYFDPGKGHPQTWNDEFNTSAAGKYQWTEPTWKEYSAKAGVNDFSNEEHQDMAAWKLAEDNYRVKTGGNLYDALLARDPTVFTANANRWSSLPGGRHPRTQLPELFGKFDEAMGTYNKPVREPIAPAPKIETPTGFMSKPKISKPTNATSTEARSSTSSRIDKPVANTAISGKTDNTRSDPTITASKTSGFMPKNNSAKVSPSDPRPTPMTPSRSGNTSTRINNTPIAGRPATSVGQKQSRATPVTPSSRTNNRVGNQTTTGSRNSSDKTSGSSTTKTSREKNSGGSRSYNPTGR